MISMFDIETTGLNPNRKTEILSYAIYYPLYNQYIIKRKDKDKDFLSYLQRYFADEKIIKICHNFKFVYTHCRKLVKIPDDTIWHCTMLMTQLFFNLDVSYTLEYQYSKITQDTSFDNIDKTVSSYLHKGFYKVPEDFMKKYQKAKVFRIYILYNVYSAEIKKEKLENIYNREIEFGKIVGDMEDFGINLHEENTKNLINKLNKDLHEITNQIFMELKEPVNLSSQKDLQEILFNKYKLPIIKYTEKNNALMNKDIILEYKMQYPTLTILDNILKWRSYRNAKTIISSYYKIYKKYNRINPIINPNKASTGRQSSQDPNLQNVQKPEAFKNLYPVNARQCFCCDEDSYLLFIDYKGIEIRLITELTKEKIYFDMLTNDTSDPHDYAAKILLGTNYHGEKLLRDACKNAQFAIAYGASEDKVNKILNMQNSNYKLFKKMLPKIGNFTRDVLLSAKKGYVTNPFGRRLYVNPTSTYSIGNHLVQSTAADILKIALLRVHNYINNNYKDLMHIVISIHDEIVLSIKKELYLFSIDNIRKDITIMMTSFDEIKIPLKLEWKLTKTTWDKAETI